MTAESVTVFVGPGDRIPYLAAAPTSKTTVLDLGYYMCKAADVDRLLSLLQGRLEVNV